MDHAPGLGFEGANASPIYPLLVLDKERKSYLLKAEEKDGSDHILSRMKKGF